MQLNNNFSFKEILLRQRLITPDQLIVAEQEKIHRPRLLGQILVELNFIEPGQLQQILSQVTGIPTISLNETKVDFGLVNLFPIEILKRYAAIPFKLIIPEKQLCLAMADPENIIYVDSLKKIFNQYLGGPTNLKLYHADPQKIQFLLHSKAGTNLFLTSNYSDQDAIETVDNLLVKAINLAASDIHLQPEEQAVRICCRIDGILQNLQIFHKHSWPRIAVRLKIMAGLDIAESRRPQTGRFEQSLVGQRVDFRLSTHPTIFGENIVIRLLNKDKNLLRLSEIGFNKTYVDYLKQIANLPQGMIIISGPTGSGKTTTLYALFSEMNTKDRNIMTLEEPVEYQLPNIRQTEIKEGGVINFSEGVRSILRQDPDVIFIGEIRDEATAKMALRSAMTGHLVIATLHSYDCFGVAARLIDLGLSPTLLSGNIICAISQRLVRKICLNCQNKGCNKCHNSGYKGRCALVEILPFNDQLHHAVSLGGSRIKIKQACGNNHQTLWYDGQNKLKAGITTQTELDRILGKNPDNDPNNE